MIEILVALLGALRNPLGAAALALVAGLGWGALVHGPARYAAGQAACQAETAAEVARQALVQRTVLEHAEAELAASRASEAGQRREAAALRELVRDACPITPEIRSRLEAIR